MTIPGTRQHPDARKDAPPAPGRRPTAPSSPTSAATGTRGGLPYSEDLVAHGYTARHLANIARRAVFDGFWQQPGTIDDSLETAWFAVVEHALEAEHRPTPLQLIRVGRAAVSAAVRDELHHHGHLERDLGAGREAMPAYQRYWTPLHGTAVEDRVVEHTALQQILARLRPSEREALHALADTGDYAAAAARLGKTQATFNVLVRTGRQAFRDWWHQGEKPSRQWRTDRRVHSRSGGASNSTRRRLTASEVEALRDRRHTGATVTELAAETGVPESTLGQLLGGRSRPAPDTPADEGGR
ncbi:MAG TPA: helix-turn-helix transcriptional regulator [Yinghuangia sp.]|nr:helix-turn-helix transcriptional regulator [Yinghuangia sp.]